MAGVGAQAVAGAGAGAGVRAGAGDLYVIFLHPHSGRHHGLHLGLVSIWILHYLGHLLLLPLPLPPHGEALQEGVSHPQHHLEQPSGQPGGWVKFKDYRLL